MKKMVLLMIMLLLPCTIVLADDEIEYDEAVKTIQEIMKDYYIRGRYIQYNSGKESRGNMPPEEATSQDMKYAVCSSYTYNIYDQAFGIYNNTKTTELIDSFPTTADETIALKKYKTNNDLVIYYENTTENNKSYYINGNSRNEEISFNDFIALIRPGDIFGYTGHVMIAYDIVDIDGDGEIDDVLMLNAGQSPFIRTKLEGTNRLSHNIFKSEYGDNGFLDIPVEGTIKYFWLSKRLLFGDGNTIKCGEEECIVVRPFYNDNNGNAKFNFNIDYNQYKKGKLRIEYPGLTIEKTVDKNDNNSVYMGDTLTYSIEVTNNSNITNNGITYQSFIIEEQIDENMQYVSANNGATIDGNIVKWNISALGAGESIILTYSATVNKLSTKPIKAIGKFYKDDNSKDVYIATGTVSNSIIVRDYLIYKNFSTCYRSSTKTGLNLINDVYACISNDNFSVDFTEFNFDNLILKKNGETYSHNNAIYLNEENNQFYKMILNNYWNALTIRNNGTSDYYYLPRWSGDKANIRAKTINPSDFKDGDVLIYYVENSKFINELGLYAYIYIDGKFVGKNYNGESNERNEFSADSYQYKTSLYSDYQSLDDNDPEYEFMNYQTLFNKDYYVILRPVTTNIILNVKDYKMISDKQILYGININTSLDELTSKIDTTGNIKGIFDGNNNHDDIKTGNRVVVEFGKDNNTLEYILSVRGDILGTGSIDKKGGKVVSKYIIDGNGLVGDEYIYAADYNYDGKIKMNDVVEMLRDMPT